MPRVGAFGDLEHHDPAPLQDTEELADVALLHVLRHVLQDDHRVDEVERASLEQPQVSASVVMEAAAPRVVAQGEPDHLVGDVDAVHPVEDERERLRGAADAAPEVQRTPGLVLDGKIVEMPDGPVDLSPAVSEELDGVPATVPAVRVGDDVEHRVVARRLIPGRFDEGKIGHASTVRQKSSPAVYSPSGFSVIHHFAPTRLFVTTSHPAAHASAIRRPNGSITIGRCTNVCTGEQRGHVVVIDRGGSARSEHARAEEVDAAVLRAPLSGPVRGLAVVAPLADTDGTGAAAVHASPPPPRTVRDRRGRDVARVEAHVLGLDGEQQMCVACSSSSRGHRAEGAGRRRANT
jgi:hypothetical protein